MAILKVKVNPKNPPIETIRRYRDFGSVMDKYTQYYRTDGIRHLLYNDRKKLVYIVLIVIFLLLLLFADDVSATDFLR